MTYGFIGAVPTQNKRTGNTGILSTADIILLKQNDQLDGWGDDLMLVDKVTLSGASSVEFTSSKINVMNTAKIIFNNITFSSAGSDLRFNVSDDGGSTFKTGASYDTNNYYQRGTTRTYSSVENNVTYGRLGSGTGTATGNSLNGYIETEGSWQQLTNINPYMAPMFFRGLGVNVNNASATAIEHQIFNSMYDVRATTLNAIKFYASTGTMSGDIYFYQYVSEAVAS